MYLVSIVQSGRERRTHGTQKGEVMFASWCKNIIKIARLMYNAYGSHLYEIPKSLTGVSRLYRGQQTEFDEWDDVLRTWPNKKKLKGIDDTLSM